MCRLEPDEQVDMIGDTPDPLRNSIESKNDASQILVESRLHQNGNRGFPMPGGKHEVIEQAGVGGGHGGDLLAPLPGCG
jgi:hypothetical protein